MFSRAAALILLTGWLAVVLSFPLTLSAADPPKNLVTNPSLEDPVDESGFPPGWGGFFSSPAEAYRTSITDGGRTGKKQFRIDAVADVPAGQFGAMAVNRVPLDRTKRFVARGWVKVVGMERATADVKLHYYAAGGAYLGQTRIGFASPGANDWQLVTVTDHADDFPQAKFIGLAIACTGDAQAQYDDLELLAFDKANLPANFDETYGITVSPQLAIIARRLGVWDRVVKLKPSDNFPQGLESSGVEEVYWAIPGMILESRGKDSKNGHEQLTLMCYDNRDGLYHHWYFGSDGTIPRGDMLGKWDAATKTITFERKPQDEVVDVAHLKFVSDDEHHWQGSIKDKQGKVLLDYEIRLTRRQGDQAAHGSTTSSSGPARPPVDAPAQAPTASIEATKELDGTWLAESVTSNGEVALPASVKLTWFKINETQVTFKIDGPEIKARLLVNTQNKPKWIDLTMDLTQPVKVKRVIGIYELKDDRLEICLTPADEKNARPDDFSSKKDSRRYLLVLKRQKE